MAAPLPDAYRIGFIGAGKMAESITRGVINSGILPPSRISTFPRRQERDNAFANMGVLIFNTNNEVVANSDVVIISVKPQVVREVILDLSPLLTTEKLIVSVAAGIKLNDLQGWSGCGRIIRVVPNTPAAVGEAASVISLGAMASKEDEKVIASLFGAVGKVWTAEEKYLDAVTGLSGSGPAYLYLAIEALSDGGVAAGLPRDLAMALASQTVLGAATMVINSKKHPGHFKDDVTSPAGTTIAGIQELEKGAFRGSLINAVVSASKRSREMSQN